MYNQQDNIDKILGAKGISVKLVMDRLKIDKYVKAHGKSFIPKGETNEKCDTKSRKLKEKGNPRTKNIAAFAEPKNWTPEHKCPARQGNCNECEKNGQCKKNQLNKNNEECQRLTRTTDQKKLWTKTKRCNR